MTLVDAINKLREQIEKNNNLLLRKERKNVATRDLAYYIRRYVQEVFEASAGLIVVTLILKKQFSVLEFVRIAFIIGFITLIIEDGFSSEFKGGMYLTFGSVAFAN